MCLVDTAPREPRRRRGREVQQNSEQLAKCAAKHPDLPSMASGSGWVVLSNREAGNKFEGGGRQLGLQSRIAWAVSLWPKFAMHRDHRCSPQHARELASSKFKLFATDHPWYSATTKLPSERKDGPQPHQSVQGQAGRRARQRQNTSSVATRTEPRSWTPLPMRAASKPPVRPPDFSKSSSSSSFTAVSSSMGASSVGKRQGFNAGTLLRWACLGAISGRGPPGMDQGCREGGPRVRTGLGQTTVRLGELRVGQRSMPLVEPGPAGSEALHSAPLNQAEPVAPTCLRCRALGGRFRPNSATCQPGSGSLLATPPFGGSHSPRLPRSATCMFGGDRDVARGRPELWSNGRSAVRPDTGDNFDATSADVLPSTLVLSSRPAGPLRDPRSQRQSAPIARAHVCRKPGPERALQVAPAPDSGPPKSGQTHSPSLRKK